MGRLKDHCKYAARHAQNLNVSAYFGYEAFGGFVDQLQR